MAGIVLQENVNPGTALLTSSKSLESCSAGPSIQYKQSTSCCSTFVPGFPDSKCSQIWPKLNHCYNKDKKGWGENRVISFGKKRVLFLTISPLILLFCFASVYNREYNTSCYGCSLCDWDISRCSAANCVVYRVQIDYAAGSSKKKTLNPYTIPHSFPPKSHNPNK